MNEQDTNVQMLMKDLAKWKNRAVEAAERVCALCGVKLADRTPEGCKGCRIQQIKDEAGNEGWR